MTEFLLYANLILLTRLVYLRHDKPLSWDGNLILLGVQLILVGFVFEFNDVVAWILGLLAAVALCNALLESRIDLDRGYRILTLILVMVIPNYLQAVTGDLEIREYITDTLELLNENITLVVELGGDEILTMNLVIFALLLLANEANILVRAVFHHCRLDPVESNQDQAERIDREEYNTGRVIGFLERWLMFLVVFFTQQLNALAFIIAAKGLARIKQLEEKKFAEYMLIGTLLSALLSVLTGYWILSLMD